MAVTALKQESVATIGDAETLTLVCKALADGLRLEILRLLRHSSFGVLELCRILDIRQSALSHHLKVLANAGLATTRREGNTIFYRRPLLANDDPLRSFKLSAFEAIDRVTLKEELRERMNQIQAERSEQSLQFFSKHAEKFREKQGLVAEHSQYTSTLEDLLQELKPHNERTVMEVGPGHGELLPMFAERFEKVIALDNALEMLNLAKATAQEAELSNAQFIHGDTGTALDMNVQCDVIVYDMVLHHLPSPREAFAHAQELLNENGLLLIIDLCRHDQDWVRESCGDLWLGFEQEELNDWAQQNNLHIGQSVYLGLRNGFQIQMCVFHKSELAHTLNH
ncbi:MAG: metalloregulator ArsR/SmtB family transcription factor [Pseudohongiellaceae bacterium]|nr:metalloregulator ArsR/SmtB family transcription factor [Pseudohongiellaceae bacterium]